MEGSTRSWLVGWSLEPMPKRSQVELFEQIRKANTGEDSPSIRELSRRFGVHRRKVHQALGSAISPPRKTALRRVAITHDERQCIWYSCIVR